MKFSHFFIDRPIFAAVLSIVIVVVGALAILGLPIAQFPDIVPPTVIVSAHYPGANPQVIADTVAAPIEQEVNGVENMLYMSAQCAGDGSMSLTVTFKLGTDVDKAQVQVQNRVSVAEPKLPEEVRRLGVTTAKRSPDITMVVNLISPDGRYDKLYIDNYSYLQVKDALARLPGIGNVTIFGARDYSMRVWLDPDKVASRGLTANDVVNAIREQNAQVAAGVIGAPPMSTGVPFQFTVNAQGRLVTEEQFGDIVVKSSSEGEVTRVRDVARIELAARDYSMDSKLNGQPNSSIGIFQLPGSNSIETSDAVHAMMERLKQSFPPGLDYRIVFDTTGFTRDSIKAVIHTLIEAMALVVLVIVVFLQTWRASLIPLLAVPVSLIGTFAAMAAMGFSLNNLSLFGLVLAIGIVVDDAIVVVENVERHIAEGLSPRDATRKAMDEVSGAVVAVGLVLSAVFIPTAFISGITGQFYRQFALTIAVSTIISTFNSLTLSPALCAILLQPHGARHDLFTRILDRTLGWFFIGFNRVFGASTTAYSRVVGRLIRFSFLALLVYFGLLGLTYFGFKAVPSGFIPTQDKGYIAMFAQLPDAASLERTGAVIDEVSRIARSIPGVRATIDLAGLNPITFAASPNAGTIFVILDDFHKRTHPDSYGSPTNGPPLTLADLTSDGIVAKLRAGVSRIQEAMVLAFPPPAVQGLGIVGGFKMQIEDRGGAGLDALQGAAFQLMGAANAQTNALQGVFTSFRAGVPQLKVDVDRIKAKSMRVPLSDLFDTLQIYLGSLYVNDFNLFGRTYQVMAQADAPFRKQPRDIANLKTRNAAGEMVPLGALVNVHDDTGPDKIVRYNMYPSAEMTGTPGPGISSGQAIALMEKLAGEALPPGMGFEWTELTLQEILAGNTAVFIFPLCVLFVFLTLAALYESWSLPLAIVLIVPMCLFSAIAGVWMRGMDNNIFTQIGFVVLVGLACKNAILIVQFAKQRQDEGSDRFTAAVDASRLRLRPILMTSFAFIFGVIPLVFAIGAGAEMRRALGTAVCSGMLGVTFFGVFLTPVFYVVIRWFAERRKKHSATVSRAAGSTPVPTLAH
ncbi:MAG TPA: efflux RND transporter permease subunit [Candidatus Dormibacteraeota bacterium]|nr:efflux RND transporter permease subunit [Candidatus Dormibacteraeota bacterium]